MPVLEPDPERPQTVKRSMRRAEPAPRVRSPGEWMCLSGVHSAQGPRPTMEDKHTVADDGWVTVGQQPRRVLGSNSWPPCAFYGCFDGHGGSRAAACASRLLWSRLQSNLIKSCRERSLPADAALMGTGALPPVSAAQDGGRGDAATGGGRPGGAEDDVPPRA